MVRRRRDRARQRRRDQTGALGAPDRRDRGARCAYDARYGRVRGRHDGAARDRACPAGAGFDADGRALVRRRIGQRRRGRPALARDLGVAGADRRRDRDRPARGVAIGRPAGDRLGQLAPEDVDRARADRAQRADAGAGRRADGRLVRAPDPARRAADRARRAGTARDGRDRRRADLGERRARPAVVRPAQRRALREARAQRDAGVRGAERPGRAGARAADLPDARDEVPARLGDLTAGAVAPAAAVCRVSRRVRASAAAARAGRGVVRLAGRGVLRAGDRLADRGGDGARRPGARPAAGAAAAGADQLRRVGVGRARSRRSSSPPGRGGCCGVRWGSPSRRAPGRAWR